MKARHKIKKILTQFDRTLKIGGIILLTMVWALAILNYLKATGTAPIHFNLSGQPDGYGSKTTLLFIPIISTIIYLAFTQINKFPYIYNYTTNITEENAKRQYTIATKMVRILKGCNCTNISCRDFINRLRALKNL